MSVPNNAVEVLIIGSGFGGLGMAIEIDRRRLGSYLILEQADGIGGTWRDNTYPGAACDVKATLYHYSYAPWAWSRTYPPQSEILAYIRATADRYRVTPRVLTNKSVVSATWKSEWGLWEVVCKDNTKYHGRYLVGATGQLNRPSVPEFPGRETFAGPQFHTARWDHSVDLAGKRVALIGSGASAIQVGPAIADSVSQLEVFQRSAPYVVPKEDPETTRGQRRRQQYLPWTTLLSRLRSYVFGELFGAGLVGKKEIRGKARAQWETYVNAVVQDSELRAKIEPDYEIGCKRVLLASDWYSTLQRDNVSLVTSGIDAITPRGVKTADGVEHEFDVLVFATGFSTTDFLAPMQITGREGQTLREVWAARPIAHRGVTVPEFPNFFVLYGPNTNLGSNSILFMLESQIQYVAHLMRAANDRDWRGIEVTPAALEEWRSMIDDESGETAWLQGCQSWYTVDGVNTNNWPKSSWQYHQLLRSVDLTNYANAS
jgi:cation diffusion facilitator CzcD-associated flavoprotein CzcO